MGVTFPAQARPGRRERPAWVDQLVEGATAAQAHQLGRFLPPPGHRRRSAVLVLFGATGSAAADAWPAAADAWPAADVLLTERAATLRSHAGQVAFPGGRIDGTDAGPAAAALREAHEETGLDPSGVEILAEMPDLYLPVSDFAVTPVLAWWHTPSPVGVVDPREVAQVARAPVPELLDPANRFHAVHPSGFVGPAFRASGLFIWGFTAGLLDRLLSLTGWERPWDHTRLQSVPVPSDPSPASPRHAPRPPSGERSGGVTTDRSPTT
jgi:8-oxo-dGTP pyrophosphatase MutT (NUDIX family)